MEPIKILKRECIGMSVCLLTVAVVEHKCSHYQHQIPQYRINERRQQKSLQTEFTSFFGLFHIYTILKLLSSSRYHNGSIVEFTDATESPIILTLS